MRLKYACIYRMILVDVLSDIEVIIMTYGEVGKKATNKYRQKFDLLQIRVEQGDRDIISKHAKEHGESVNKFINRAIKETMERDGNMSKSDSNA